MTLLYEGDYIVGGRPEEKVSPNFCLRELIRTNGVIRVHRELVSALQILRDRFSSSVSVTGMSPRGGLGDGRQGLVVWLRLDRTLQLEAHAQIMHQQGYFSRVQVLDGDLYLDIGDPENLPDIDRDTVLETAVQVTAGFETSGDPFQQVTGNFDGAGLSFGPSQVNFLTGTLTPLFNKFRLVDELAYETCFEEQAHYHEWLRVLAAPVDQQLAWADRLSRGGDKRDFAQPWKAYFQALGRVEEFRRIMTEHATSEYGKKLSVALDWLFEQPPIQIYRLRCLCALYDLCTQQGSLNKAHEQIRQRLADDPPVDQFELVRIAVMQRGLTASRRWRADCVSRRLTLLNRQTTFFRADGQSAKRGNRFLYLLRDVRV